MVAATRHAREQVVSGIVAAASSASALAAGINLPAVMRPTQICVLAQAETVRAMMSTLSSPPRAWTAFASGPADSALLQHNGAEFGESATWRCRPRLPMHNARIDSAAGKAPAFSWPRKEPEVRADQTRVGGHAVASHGASDLQHAIIEKPAAEADAARRDLFSGV